VVRPAVAQPEQAAPQAPATPPEPAGAGASAPPEPPQPPRSAVDPDAIASARGAIQATRAPGAVQRSGPDLSDADVSPDDPDADDGNLAGAELLQRELGAKVIEEIKHE
jgi:DNA polymerase-3 subunit gamma/tau